MYKQDKSLALKGSASALLNNLSVSVNLDKNSISYAVVHKSVVNYVTTSIDGSTVNHRQIVCKEPSTGSAGSSIIQAKLLSLPSRTIMVITSQRGVQMFEADSALMLFWHPLSDLQSGDESTFGRGICPVADRIICVGTHEDQILVFNIPVKGGSVTLSEILHAHKAPLCDLRSENDRMISADDYGHIIAWRHTADTFSEVTHIFGSGVPWSSVCSRVPCSSVALWHDLVVGGFATGHIRLFSLITGNMVVEITAHVRWCTSIDIAQDSGMILSVSDDSFIRIWQIEESEEIEVKHVFSESMTDQQLQGACFVSRDGRAFAVTGYDSCNITFFRRS